MAPLWCDLGFVPICRGNKAEANLHPIRLLSAALNRLPVWEKGVCSDSDQTAQLLSCYFRQLCAKAWKQSMTWVWINCNQSLQPKKKKKQMKCDPWRPCPDLHWLYKLVWPWYSTRTIQQLQSFKQKFQQWQSCMQKISSRLQNMNSNIMFFFFGRLIQICVLRQVTVSGVTWVAVLSLFFFLWFCQWQYCSDRGFNS